MPRHYVLIDFENVHQIDVGMLNSNAVNLVVLAGAKQKKIDFDLVQGMLEHAAGLKLVRLKSSSKNAVDFALAFYLGQAVLEDSRARFHLVSKDKGYGPLVDHLKDRGFEVERVDSCHDLGFSWPGKERGPIARKSAKKAAKKAAKKSAKKAAKKVAAKKVVKKAGKKPAKPSSNKPVDVVKRRLENNPKSRPARRKSLCSKVGEIIGAPADGSQVEKVIGLAERAGWLSFNSDGVPKYQF
ncbi:MAG: PIN domain-containing protein [Haloferula sp.]|uniref:PIN domain-containing protein n=1 Tax=Haloferula sp. TaxID=2497595 RepID=UPI00329D70BB